MLTRRKMEKIDKLETIYNISPPTNLIAHDLTNLPTDRPRPTDQDQPTKTQDGIRPPFRRDQGSRFQDLRLRGALHRDAPSGGCCGVPIHLIAARYVPRRRAP